MNKNISFMALIVGVLLGAAAPAHAQLSANLALVSDYTFRGIVQNDSHPALQGGVDYAHSSGAYIGTWASNVDFNDRDETFMEWDIYGGFKFPLAGFTVDVGGIAYLYPGQNQSTNHYNFFDAKVGVSKDFGFASGTAQVNHSPNYFGSTSGTAGHSTYASFNGAAPLGNIGINALGSIGRMWMENNTNFGAPDYTDWSLGAGYSWQSFDFALKYVDTSIEKARCFSGSNWCDARVVFSIARTFK